LNPFVDGNQAEDLFSECSGAHGFVPRVQKVLLKIKKFGMYAIEQNNSVDAQKPFLVNDLWGRRCLVLNRQASIYASK